MLVVLDRNRTAKLLVLAVLFAAAGTFWFASGRERAQLAQTSAPPREPVDAAASGGQLGQVEVRVPPAVLFDEYRMERDRARSAQIELLRSALSDRTLTDERRDQLTTELFALLQREERELQAETLLKAKGYADAVVVLGAHGANAVVPDVLEQSDAARIGELVARATGVALERITIIDGAAR